VVLCLLLLLLVLWERLLVFVVNVCVVRCSYRIVAVEGIELCVEGEIDKSR